MTFRSSVLLPLLVLAGGAVAGSTDTRVVERVSDGDTIVLDGGEKVRLIGVDTPETVHPRKPVQPFGKEASAFTKRLSEGKRVRLEYEAEAGPSRIDRYGRTLAYVYLTDGRMLNLEIVRQGYGHAYTKYPFSRMDEFRAAERHAREAGLGLWGSGEPETERGISEQPEARAPPAAAARDCIPREQCCRICAKGQPCGASCISAAYTCRKGRGCACHASEICP